MKTSDPREHAQYARTAAYRATRSAAAATRPVARGVARGHAHTADGHAARARYHYARTITGVADTAAAYAAVWPMVLVIVAAYARPVYTAHVAAYRATLAARSAMAHVAARDAARDAAMARVFASAERARWQGRVPIYARGVLAIERAVGITRPVPTPDMAARVASAHARFSTAEHERFTPVAVTDTGRYVWPVNARQDGPNTPTYTPTATATPYAYGPTYVATPERPWGVVPVWDALAAYGVMLARRADIRASMAATPERPWPTFPHAGYATPTWQYVDTAPAAVRPVPTCDTRPTWVSPWRRAVRVFGQYRSFGRVLFRGWRRRVWRTDNAMAAAITADLGVALVPTAVMLAVAAEPTRPHTWVARAERWADAVMVAAGDVHYDSRGNARGVLYQRPDVYNVARRRLEVRPDRVAFRGVSRELSTTDANGRTRRVYRGARVRYETAVRADGRRATPYVDTPTGRVWRMRTWVAVNAAWNRRFTGHTADGFTARVGNAGRRARAAERAAAGATGRRGPKRSAWTLSERGVRSAMARVTEWRPLADALVRVAYGVDRVAAGGRITLACSDGTHVAFTGDGYVTRENGQRYELVEYARRAAIAGVWPLPTSGHAWPTPETADAAQ